MHSGYSIGGFDADRIDGDMTLGVGTADDIFHGIGRGLLNIEGMPVYRDNVGGVGTPTSDEERTKITMETTRLLITINAYGSEMPLEECVEWTIELLKKYAQATEIESYII
jgi:DNA/RNA-binding domain of Phe-tRNA-synthetase-like protein